MQIIQNSGGAILLLCIILLCSSFTSAKDVYVNATRGDDTHTGDLRNPFRTLQKAATTMAPGDVCTIRAGVYRETLIPKADGLTFRNYENEYVLITGLDVVKGWTAHQGEIWKAGFTRPATDPFKATMVFVNGKRMNWARFPNEDGDMFNNTDMKRVNVGLDKNDGSHYLGTVDFNDLPSPAKNAWAGAYFVGVADKRNWFTANKGVVKESDGTSLVVDDISWNWHNGFKFGAFLKEGFGYLIGHMRALDVETEWHLQDNTLYLYPPAGTDMETALVEGRRRVLGLDLSGRSDITLKGIHFKAAGVTMDGSVNCVLDGCSFRHASSFSAYRRNAWGDYKNGDGGIYVSGHHNTVKNCYIGQTWGYGVTMWGHHNTLENSIVEHCNWQAERMANVASPGDDNIIRHNTIRYGGREGIELGNSGWIGKYAKRALIQYNHVHHGGLLCPDGGLLYTNHQGGRKAVANTEISYNLWHDYARPHGGIYLDNQSSGYNIHHNVVWNVKSGIHMNDLSADKNTHDVYVYHNTLINTEFAVRWNKGKLGSLDTHNVVVRNNHSNGGVFMGTEVSDNRSDLTDAEFVDSENGNYRLKSTSASIDKGIVLAGINDQAVELPDLGAYEYGGPDWTVGADIEIPSFPDEKEGWDGFTPGMGKDSSVSGILKKWHTVTVSFSGPESDETADNPNPFRDYRLQVLFTGPGGQTYDVPGFYDGDGQGKGKGNIWKVHFSPDQEGPWQYKASFRQGDKVAVSLVSEHGRPTGFDGASGTFQVCPLDPQAPGFLKWGRLDPSGCHYFKFRDGPYFLKGGADSPENFLGYQGFDNTTAGPEGIHTFSTHISDWQEGDPDWSDGKAKGIIGALNYLSSQHVNSIYIMLMNIGGDGKDVWPFAGAIDRKGSPTNDNLHYDISKLRQWGIVFDHAQKKGLNLHFLLNEAEPGNKKELDNATLGTERKLFYREMCARFGHHNAITWNLCEEYNYNYPLTPEVMKEFAGYIHTVNPYSPLITLHHLGDLPGSWSHFIGDERFDIISLQTKHFSVMEQLRAASAEAGMPMPVSLDEFHPQGTKVGSEDFHRKWFTWPVLFSGASIEFISSELLKNDDYKKYEPYWRDLWTARKFIIDHLPFWEMEPADELLSGAAAMPVVKVKPVGGQVFAKAGAIYAIYLPVASQEATLDLTGRSGTYEQRWFNPRTGQFAGTANTVVGDQKIQFGFPPDTRDEDWVTLLRNTNFGGDMQPGAIR